MYHVAICDDEKEILVRITERIRTGFAQSQIKVECTALGDSRELVEMLDSRPVDICFLDIDMPYFGGMEVAKMIGEKNLNTLLVFVTSHDSLVYQTFAYRPFGFIRKSCFDREVGEVIGRLVQELLSRRENLLLHKGQEVLPIRIEDIFYMEASGNYVEISTKKGKERTRETLASLLEELKGKKFVRCHKGYVVNAKQIQRMNSREMELADGTVIPIGRNYEKEVRQKILEMMR